MKKSYSMSVIQGQKVYINFHVLPMPSFVLLRVYLESRKLLAKKSIGVQASAIIFADRFKLQQRFVWMFLNLLSVFSHFKKFKFVSNVKKNYFVDRSSIYKYLDF